ncbi:hypothetical protein [Sneathiella chinensis]|uniref:Uncharacterized protein n=1 Tax=Sneathiella chinensis TaxID=349750 RepID=A0ABQ5TZ02_9PROT|nr:hypothetical protein [Sneathiella chinensis]GLQ05104.1 hypothetical protein GCM10007924_03250 [Sneathiella chinensis]
MTDGKKSSLPPEKAERPASPVQDVREFSSPPCRLHEVDRHWLWSEKGEQIAPPAATGVGDGGTARDAPSDPESRKDD